MTENTVSEIERMVVTRVFDAPREFCGVQIVTYLFSTQLFFEFCSKWIRRVGRRSNRFHLSGYRKSEKKMFPFYRSRRGRPRLIGDER